MKPSVPQVQAHPSVEGATLGRRSEAPKVKSVRAVRSRTGCRVLVAAADRHTRELLRDVLDRCGLGADIVDNGVAAVARARRKLPAVIIVDLQLRDSPGLEVIQWLRSNAALKSTPVIMLTTNASDVGRSKSWSVNAVMLKPLSSETIENAIRDLVDQKDA